MEKKKIEALKGIVGEENIKENEKLSGHTSFKVGGPADLFIFPKDAGELKNIISYLKAEAIDFFILGNGSNILVSDAGFKGAVISLSRGFSGISAEGEGRLRAGAGARLSSLVRAALDHSLTGLEFAAGIPGSVGGGVVMNAGAYGGELCQVISEVTLFDHERGEVIKKTCEDMGFSYRNSIVRHGPYIVLEAEVRLSEKDSESIRQRMEELMEKRAEKQPLEYPSAGSTFKRPEGYFAGKLIEDSGLKGAREGGAEVSTKHSGFIINTGNATAGDIMKLIKRVQKEVLDKQGVSLETEVIPIGWEQDK